MDLYFKQEITVGGLVIAALAVLVGGLMWLTGQSIRTGGRVSVRAQFTSVQGLTKGDPVMVSGVQVGQVANVHLAEVGRVDVELDVLERHRPHVDATAAVRSLDFMGAKFVLYDPGQSETFLDEDEVIVGSEERDIASGAGELADQASALLENSRELLSPETARQVRATLASAEQALNVVRDVGSGPMVDDLAEAISTFTTAASRLDSILANPAIQRSIDEMDDIAIGVREMTEGFSAVAANLAMLLEQMRSPDGTVGRFLTDSTLYVDMHETMVSLRMLLDDVRERPGRYVQVSVF